MVAVETADFNIVMKNHHSEANFLKIVNTIQGGRASFPSQNLIHNYDNPPFCGKYKKLNDPH